MKCLDSLLKRDDIGELIGMLNNNYKALKEFRVILGMTKGELLKNRRSNKSKIYWWYHR